MSWMQDKLINALVAKGIRKNDAIEASEHLLKGLEAIGTLNAEDGRKFRIGVSISDTEKAIFAIESLMK